jgi:hypothetical protein
LFYKVAKYEITHTTLKIDHIGEDLHQIRPALQVALNDMRTRANTCYPSERPGKLGAAATDR